MNETNNNAVNKDISNNVPNDKILNQPEPINNQEMYINETINQTTNTMDQTQNNNVLQENVQTNMTTNMEANQIQSEMDNPNLNQQENVEIVQDNKNNNDKIEKAKKSYLGLLSVSLVASVLKVPYLYNQYNKNLYLDRETIDLCFLIIGIIAIVLCVVTFILKPNKKSKYIVGLIAGILVCISGNIVGFVAGILLALDSGRLIKTAN